MIVMENFNLLFPNFTTRCSELQSILTPVAYLFLVIGMISSTVGGHHVPEASLWTFGRTIVYIVVLTQLVTWGNQISTIVDTTVKEVLNADPSKVYTQYSQALETRKSTTSQAGWWEKLFNLGASVFEAVISALLWIVGFLASIIVFYAYLVQKFILYVGYALSPIFIGFLAVRTLNQIGVNYLLSLTGVMIWPLGWGVASLVTEGLLDFMTDQSFLWNQSMGGAAGYAFQNFIGVAFVGVWLIFSTIAAPIIIQRAIATGIQVGSVLVGGATTAMTAAMTGGVMAAGAWGAAEGTAALATGTVSGLVTAGVTLAGSSLNGSTYSPTGSLLTALGQMRGKGVSNKQRNTDKSDPNAQMSPAIDGSGDQAVQALLQKTKNPHS